MVLLLRYSGLRMQDAACLERSRLKNSRLFLYTQKTGAPVYLPLPPAVMTVLENTPNAHPDYVFWDGRSERETTVKSWNRVFRKIFAMAEPPIAGGHPHRFRDTFAVVSKKRPRKRVGRPMTSPMRQHGDSLPSGGFKTSSSTAKSERAGSA